MRGNTYACFALLIERGFLYAPAKAKLQSGSRRSGMAEQLEVSAAPPGFNPSGILIVNSLKGLDYILAVKGCSMQRCMPNVEIK